LELSEKTFLKFLNEPNLELTETTELSAEEMGELYIYSALLSTIMGFLKEQLWLSDKEDLVNNIETTYEEFINKFLLKELKPLGFLEDFLIKSGASEIKTLKKSSLLIEKKVLSLIMNRSPMEQKTFLIHALKDMSKKFLKEESDQEGFAQNLGHQGLRLYRTFDGLDKIFKLDYQLDLDMDVDYHEKERIYQSGGVGVQSGYSTILLSLDAIEVKSGDLIVDLGSGYGRVGLVYALLRPDTQSIGYEFVPHRVQVANEASELFELSESLNFKTQDLSLESFKIPEAAVYYMYDPFTEDTYKYVLDQIVAFSQKRKLTIVTKGNGSKWLDRVASENHWPAPKVLDEGNLCIYHSSK
tara:strand:- start:41073 stop:42140 length:1068 start_codon:yes stop_codon:yes gene_type:complete